MPRRGTPGQPRCVHPRLRRVLARCLEVVVRHLPASLHGYAPTQRGHGDADHPPTGSTSPKSVPDELLDVLVGESLKVPARVWKETMRGLIEADVPVTLDQITAPTLLISGDHNAFVSSDQQLLLRGIPDARLASTQV